ncbi:hypothetical protein [Deinococcus radiophilus]|uniref:Tetratricopeptide repeat protein n=1 Tax=Deinococcus radiophilus TaxID=32062 RepID=A0A431VRQ5_9DEIO|nr:hypothetical protein [Deinococcus radiophilus]RTR25900.1 hypothetical protein EJ104_09335 [Deinococcus radiophilus]UFA49690.1 hypothetical protein LMT64_07255 [Deinococcus radiophilus]
MSRRGLAGLLLSMALLAGGASAQTDPDGNPGSGLIGTGQVVPVARPPLPAVAPDTLPEVQLSGRELSGVQGGQTVWSHAWPPELGAIRGPLRQGNTTYLGVGPAVLALSETGEVLARYDLSAPVLTLDGSGGLIRATVSGPGYRETLTLIPPQDGGGVQERVVFAPDPAVTLWTMRAADLIPDAQVQSAWQQDRLNPFLGLRAAVQARNAGDRRAEAARLKQVMGSTQPFAVWTKLAARLDAAGYPSLADDALESARIDAAQRGLDPSVRVSRAALEAYGHPAGYIGTLLDQGRLNRAEVWMAHLRLMHPRVEGGGALFLRYAALLESQNRSGEASEWRRFAASLGSGTLYGQGALGLEKLRDFTGLLSAALALSLLLALLSIFWQIRRLSLRHTGTGERLVVLGLSSALVLSLSGGLWAAQAAGRLNHPALNTGTYGGAWAEAGLATLSLTATPDAALLRGLGPQLSGDLSAARHYYQVAAEQPCGRNNLGTISELRGDRPTAEARYRSALGDEPGLGAAAYNLNFPVLTLGSEFQERYRPGQPRLCYPDDRSLLRALSGDIRSVWRTQLSDPQAQLSQVWQLARRGQVSGWATLWAAQLLALAALLLLILPRTEAEPTLRPRSADQRLLSWLLPGSGLLDWVWGGVLLLVFVLAGLTWVSGYALELLGRGQPLPWPLHLWPPTRWPASLSGLGNSWPLLLMALAWVVNAALLWRIGVVRRQVARQTST